MSENLEDRVRALESKIHTAIGAFAVLAVWLGVTTFYSIPNAINNSLETKAAKDATAEIDRLLKKSHVNSELIAQISSNGTINIGGSCFKPRQLVRCFGKPGGANDHMTWIDNASECQSASYGVEASVLLLAQC